MVNKFESDIFAAAYFKGASGARSQSFRAWGFGFRAKNRH